MFVVVSFVTPTVYKSDLVVTFPLSSLLWALLLSEYVVMVGSAFTNGCLIGEVRLWSAYVVDCVVCMAISIVRKAMVSVLSDANPRCFTRRAWVLVKTRSR